MPLFSNNYDRPGPGVPKDEAQKPGIIRYFIVIGRHFWDLGIINFFYFITSIPAIAIFFFIAAFTLPPDLNENGYASFWIGMILPAFLGNGPVRTGVCYVLRNYSREKHAFLWSDFREYAKKYFLRSTFFFLINIVFVFVVLLDINFYFELAKSGAFAGMVSIYIAIFLFIIYMVFNSYFNMLTVTFEMSVGETVKKAFALTMGKIIQNIGCVIICIAFAYLIVFIMSSWPVLQFLLLLLGYSYIMLLLDMNSFSVVKKYMVKEEE